MESAAPHPLWYLVLSGLARTPISNTVTFPSACPLPRDQTRAASLKRHGALNFGTRATRPNCFGCRTANGLVARLSAAKGPLSLCLPSVSPLSIQLPTGQAKPRTPSASVFHSHSHSLSRAARRGHERPLIVQSFPSPSYCSSNTAVALSHPLGGTRVRVRVSPEPELTSFPRPSFEQDNQQPTPRPRSRPCPPFLVDKTCFQVET